jgi:hypothetical protein
MSPRRASQYPHPEEDGVIAFTMLMVSTPILSLVALLRHGAREVGGR